MYEDDAPALLDETLLQEATLDEIMRMYVFIKKYNTSNEEMYIQLYKRAKKLLYQNQSCSYRAELVWQLVNDGLAAQADKLEAVIFTDSKLYFSFIKTFKM